MNIPTPAQVEQIETVVEYLALVRGAYISENRNEAEDSARDRAFTAVIQHLINEAPGLVIRASDAQREAIEAAAIELLRKHQAGEALPEEFRVDQVAT